MNIADVEATLGRPLRDEEVQQAEAWEQQARLAIAAHRPDATVSVDVFLDSLDQAILMMVLAEAVALRLRNPEAVTQRDVQIDDGRISKRYSSSSGQISILPEWLAWLGIGTHNRRSRRAFTVLPS